MKIILAILSISLFLQAASSQSNFQKGYVVQLNHDTIYGLINYKSGGNNNNNCQFKDSQSKDVVLYAPAKISGFGFVNDKYYESRKINKEDNTPVFIELLIKGKASLYKLKNDFYIVKNDSILYKLDNESQQNEIEGRTVYVVAKKYIGILTFLLSDCQGIDSQIKRTTLAEKSLTDLIIEYNTRSNTSSTIYKTTKPWLHARTGISGGINITRMSVMADYSSLGNLKSAYKFSPIFGISFDLSSPRITERTSFHAEVFYLNTKYNMHSQKNYYNSSILNFIAIETSMLKIPFGVRYTFPTTKTTPFIDLDIIGTLHLNTKSNWKEEIVSDTYSETVVDGPLPLVSHQLGMGGGAGILTKMGNKLLGFMEIRIERTGGGIKEPFISQSALNSKVTNFQLVLGISAR